MKPASISNSLRLGSQKSIFYFERLEARIEIKVAQSLCKSIEEKLDQHVMGGGRNLRCVQQKAGAAIVGIILRLDDFFAAFRPDADPNGLVDKLESVRK